MSTGGYGSVEHAYRCRRCDSVCYSALPDVMERGSTCPRCDGPLERWRHGDRHYVPTAEPSRPGEQAG